MASAARRDSDRPRQSRSNPTAPARSSGVAQTEHSAETDAALVRSNGSRDATDCDPDDEGLAFRLLIKELEQLAHSIDKLDDELGPMIQRIMKGVGQRLTGAGVVGVIIKAEALSSKLQRLAQQLRKNELHRKVEREAMKD